MALLKGYANSLDEIDEGLRPLYTEAPDGTGFVLDVDDTEYRAKLREFRDTNINLDKARAELEAKLKQFEGIDPIKYRDAMNAMGKLDQLEDAQLIKDGRLDDVIKKRTEAMRADLEAQIKAKDDVIRKAGEEAGAYRTRLGSLLIDASVQSAANKAGTVRPGAMFDLLGRARQTFAIDEQGQMVPRNAKGETLFGKDGNPLGVEEWAVNLLTEAPHLFEGGKGGGATGGARGDGRGAVGTVDRGDPAAMGRNLKEIAAGKMKVVG